VAQEGALKFKRIGFPIKMDFSDIIRGCFLYNYDKRRRARWDAPAAVLGTINAKNHLVTPYLIEALWRRVLPNMNF
jgi:hypothetical protein